MVSSARPEFAERGKDAADGVVDQADHAVGERDRLPCLGLAAERERAVSIARRLAGGQLVVQPGERRRHVRPGMMKRGRHFNARGIVHVPIPARRRERVMRIGKRAEHEERLVLARRCVLLQPRHGSLADVARRVELRRQARAPCLRRRDATRGKSTVRTTHIRSGLVALLQPVVIVAEHEVAVLVAQLDVIEAVVRRAYAMARLSPRAGQLLRVLGSPQVLAARVRQTVDRLALRLRARLQHRRVVLHVLDVRLADQHRGVAVRAQQLGERDLL